MVLFLCIGLSVGRGKPNAIVLLVHIPKGYPYKARSVLIFVSFFDLDTAVYIVVEWTK